MQKRVLTVSSRVKEETLSPEQFARLTKESPHLVEKSRFVPPRIGQRGFGNFQVRYIVPILKNEQIV